MHRAVRGNALQVALILLVVTFLVAARATGTDGDLIWKAYLESGIQGSPAVGDDGTVYCGSSNGSFFALNPDGTLKWRVRTAGVVSGSAAIGGDGTVYVPSQDGYLYALAPDDGTELWRFKISEPVTFLVNRPAIAADGTIYCTSPDGNLYAVAPDGTGRWVFGTQARISGSPAVGADGTIYFGSHDGRFYAVGPDGSPRWNFAVDGEEFRTSPAIAQDGTIYAGCTDASLYAFSPSGALVWSTEVRTAHLGTIFSSPVIGEDGTVYVCNHGGLVFAVSPGGDVLATVALSGTITSTPAIDDDGTLYVGASGPHAFYAIGPDSEIAWSKTFDYSIYYSSPAIVDDVVYIGCDDNYLYAFEISSAGLADSPWPMANRDAKHSGRVEAADAADAPEASAADASADADGSALTLWTLPFADAFPAGIAVPHAGIVYAAASGGRVVVELEPIEGAFRSWGVGEGPSGILMAAGYVFFTVSDDGIVGYLTGDGHTTSNAILPTRTAGPMEIHRGADLDTGELVFWIGEWTAGRLLRWVVDPARLSPSLPPRFDPTSVVPTESIAAPERVTASMDTYTYVVSNLPAPYPVDPVVELAPFTEWEILGPDYPVHDIAVGPDGRVWASVGMPLLFVFDPSDRTLQGIEPTGTIFSGLAIDEAGRVWYADADRHGISMLDFTGGSATVWEIPGTTEIYDLAFDDRGRIWFTDRIEDLIGRFDPQTLDVEVYRLPEGSEPLFLALDEVGSVWFTAGSGNAIGRLTPAE